MSKEEIKKLAEEISFRLLATKKHNDFEWLVETIENYVNQPKNSWWQRLFKNKKKYG